MGYFLSERKFNLFTHFKSGKFLSHFSGFLFQHKKKIEIESNFPAIHNWKSLPIFLKLDKLSVIDVNRTHAL